MKRETVATFLMFSGLFVGLAAVCLLWLNLALMLSNQSIPHVNLWISILSLTMGLILLALTKVDEWNFRNGFTYASIVVWIVVGIIYLCLYFARW